MRFHMHTSFSTLRRAGLAAVLLGSLVATGCAHRPTNQQVGIGVGAVAGGAVGHVLFGGPAGTVGGAAAGALIGNEVGRRTR